MRRAVLVLMMAGLCPSFLDAEQGDRLSTGPIERLTPETRELALACGRSGAECAVHRYQLCREGNAHYSLRLITPFSRVAEAAFDSQQTGKPLGRMGPATVNRWGIALSVAPAERSESAAAIKSVEIQRGRILIQPTRSTVGPFTIEVADGSARQLARGFFVFPASAFEPTSDITIVLAGSTGEESCAVNRERLRTLQ
jgi:hypothetical protein